MNLQLVDISKFNIPAASVRREFEDLAKIAEAAERFMDMCMFMKQVVLASISGEDLTYEERNLLSVAYKNAVGARRMALRKAMEERVKDDIWNDQFIKCIEMELENICADILQLLENTLIPHPKSDRYSQVFYKKMTGDYYRYWAEFAPQRGYDKKAAEYYAQSMALAQTFMEPTDPQRLGLALNYSVCLYETVKDRASACKLAHRAFEDAVNSLEKLGEKEYRDATLIMHLIRDNLNLWTTEEEDD